MEVIRRPGTLVRVPVPERELHGTADEIDAISREGVDLFLQASPGPRGVVLYLHGKSGAFNRGTSWWLPTLLADLPLVHASASMRCHSLGYSVRAGADDQRGGLRGGMWEDIDAGAADVAAAVSFLAGEYGLPIWLAGHSSGGFYVATGAAAARQPLAGRILLSPLITHHKNFPEWFGGEEETARALARARDMVASGKGHLLIPLPVAQWGISAWSLVQRAEQPPGAWHQALGQRDSPVLMGWTVPRNRPASSLRTNYQRAYDQIEVAVKSRFVLHGASHTYDGYETEVASQLREFIRRGLADREFS